MITVPFPRDTEPGLQVCLGLFFSLGKEEMNQSAVLQAMRDPGFYPEAPRKIEVRETHISTLFLTDDRVYKVKKPVNFGFLDFTALSARKFFCEQELLLNRRLAPDVYLTVLPIYRSGDRISFRKGGSIVEYALQMRRLPRERMMEALLTEGKIDQETIRKIAFHLIGFHSRARTGAEISIYGTAERILKNCGENFLQTAPFIGKTVTQDQYNRIRNYTETFFEQHRSLFEKRMEDHRIRDCHGDIRIEHICIEDRISIFDCVEFNRRFRYSDVASDIAFLAMDLDFHEVPVFSRCLVSTYVDYTRDIDLLKLIRFYKCYRAYVRGKVESFQGMDANRTRTASAPALSRARKYFSLAAEYAEDRPYLVITTGLTGTGKSVLARALARDLSVALFQSDVIRKEISGVPLDEHRLERFGEGIYSEEITRKTYQRLFEKGEEELVRGRPVFLDATFLKSDERKMARNLAEKSGAAFFILEVTSPEIVVTNRLKERIRREGEVSDGRPEIYALQKEIFEPVREVSPGCHLVVDTSRKEDPLPQVEKQILLVMET